EQCWELVGSSPIGRVAFLEAGDPMVLPVTHLLHDHQIVFRSASGSKLEAAEHNKPVAFEVDSWDETAHEGWSVLVQGVAEAVYDEDQIAEYKATGLVPWLTQAAAGTWVRIIANDISGRRLPH